MQKKIPKISVCVVTYNQEKYIRQCLQSIVDQIVDFDFEIIVADDCSTDKTRIIVKEFSDKYPKIIKPIFHDKNMGAMKNFIYVHQQALGKYVSHMDGDDYALPGKIQMQAAVLDSEERCNAVWHGVDYFDDHGNFSSGKTADLSVFHNGQINFEEAIRLGFVGVHSSLMYRRSAREAVSINNQYLDLFFTWDLLSKGSGFFIDEILGRYRIAASGSLTVSSASKISLLTIEHAKFFLKKFPEQRGNFFIWAITNAMAQVKNRNRIAFSYLKFCLQSFSFVKPHDVVVNMVNLKKIQVKWNQRIKYSPGDN